MWQVKFVSMMVVGCFFVSVGSKSVAAQSPDDFNKNGTIVAATILAEARGEGFDGMQAVACVIKQRMIERGKDAATICLQRKQFSCWNGVTFEELCENVLKGTPDEITDFAIALAVDLVSGKDFDRKSVGCANHYCTLETYPGWAKGKKPVKVIGRHKFYRL